MCNLNHKSLIGMFAVSLMTVAANAQEKTTDVSASASLVVTDEDRPLDTRDADRTELEPIGTCPDPVDPSLDEASLLDAITALLSPEQLAEREVAKLETADRDASGMEKPNYIPDPNLILTERTIDDVEYERLPLPGRGWTSILGGEMQAFSMVIAGWAVFNVLDWNDLPLEVTIYDQRWHVLSSFHSNECGSELFLEPQVINIVILNPYRAENAYDFNVYQ